MPSKLNVVQLSIKPHPFEKRVDLYPTFDDYPINPTVCTNAVFILSRQNELPRNQ